MSRTLRISGASMVLGSVIIGFTAAFALAAAGAIDPAFAAESSAAGEARAAAQRGMTAYLSGRYADALPDLEMARDGGAATGTLLYMLGFCYDTVSHDAEASTKAFDAAGEALENEAAGTSPSVETWFYLSNLALNRHDLDGSRKAAEAGVTAIEKGRVKVGKDGISLFRAGKLYADAGNADKAVDYHRRAVEAFSKDDSAPPEYLRRALETLAKAGDTKIDPQIVAKTWERLLTKNPSIPNGDWYLGLACLRAGRYAVARDAFERIRLAGGDRAQDAYYAASLASAALELTNAGVKIPEKDADRKLIAALDSQALDQRIAGYAKKAGEVLDRAITEKDCVIVVTEKGKKRISPGPKLEKEIREIHRYFIALTISLTLRGESLQARAFEGGFAPLIIQNWERSWRNSHRELQERIGQSPPGGAD